MGEVIDFLEEKKKRQPVIDVAKCPCEGEGLHLSVRMLSAAEKLDNEKLGENRKRS